MKSIVLNGIQDFKIIDVPKPGIKNSNDVLIKIAAVGVCGSDVHYYKTGKIGDQVVQYPFAIGHECSGIVEDVGDAVHRVKPGDPVFIEPAVSCGLCDQCLNNRRHTCRNIRFLGCPGQLDGALSEYLIMPEENCFPLPSVSHLEHAVLIEPLSIAVYALQLLNTPGIDTIGILGVGPIGLSVLVEANFSGAKKIYVTDKLNYRLDIAGRQSACWTGNPDDIDIVEEIKSFAPDGLDAVFECCGQQDALDNAIDILKPGGRLFVIGIPEPDRISFDISKLRRKELTIQNVRRQNNCVQKALNRIVNQEIDVDFMITHSFDPVKIHEAYDIVSQYDDNVVKAIVKMTN